MQPKNFVKICALPAAIVWLVASSTGLAAQPVTPPQSPTTGASWTLPAFTAPCAS